MTRLWLWTVTPSTVFSVLCHFVILYMVSIEIVSFCRIISLWNFQYRNHVHSITLMSFQIISQNLVQYKAWLDDVQRLRTVTSLDVSAVAGHHAMPAALLLQMGTALFFLLFVCYPGRCNPATMGFTLKGKNLLLPKNWNYLRRLHNTLCER